MAAMLVFWIASGVLVALAVKRVWFPYDRPSPGDSAVVGGAGALLAGSVIALITGGGDWFDPLATAIALIGAAAAVIVWRRFDWSRTLRRIKEGLGTPPRPAR